MPVVRASVSRLAQESRRNNVAAKERQTWLAVFFQNVCRNFVLPEGGKPCLLLFSFLFCEIYSALLLDFVLSFCRSHKSEILLDFC